MFLLSVKTSCKIYKPASGRNVILVYRVWKNVKLISNPYSSGFSHQCSSPSSLPSFPPSLLSPSLSVSLSPLSLFLFCHNTFSHSYGDPGSWGFYNLPVLQRSLLFLSTYDIAPLKAKDDFAAFGLFLREQKPSQCPDSFGNKKVYSLLGHTTYSEGIPKWWVAKNLVKICNKI